MLCRNCNYILNGDEAFCPHCGFSLKAQDEKNIHNEKEEQDISNKTNCSIFENEASEQEDILPQKSKKSKSAANVIALFIFILIVIAAFTAVQYFDLAPAISSLISSAVSSENTETTRRAPLEEDFDSSTGVISPDINYKPAQYTVSAPKALPLRKGPSESYALVASVSPGTRLQITGGSLENDSFVYVYIPSEDTYGWLNASYLTESSLLQESLSTTAEPESTTEKEAEKEVKGTVHKARITAEKGLYLRVGPGADFEAVTVIGKDEEVTLIEECASNPSWVYVQFGKYKGYVSKNYISEV